MLIGLQHRPLILQNLLIYGVFRKLACECNRIWMLQLWGKFRIRPDLPWAPLAKGDRHEIAIHHRLADCRRRSGGLR